MTLTTMQHAALRAAIISREQIAFDLAGARASVAFLESKHAAALADEAAICAEVCAAHAVASESVTFTVTKSGTVEAVEVKAAAPAPTSPGPTVTAR